VCARHFVLSTPEIRAAPRSGSVQQGTGEEPSPSIELVFEVIVFGEGLVPQFGCSRRKTSHPPPNPRGSETMPDFRPSEALRYGPSSADSRSSAGHRRPTVADTDAEPGLRAQRRPLIGSPGDDRKPRTSRRWTSPIPL